MWHALLPKVINMSLTASIVILFVLLARLLLKRAPKVYSYTLWAVVLFRLLCPVALNSNFSLLGLIDVPVTESGTMEYITASNTSAVYPNIAASVPEINTALPENSIQEVQPVVNLSLSPEAIIGALWLLGIAVLLAYSVIALLRLHRKLIGAVLLRDNIYLADHIGSPFVIGLLRPRIYLPSSLTDREQEYILLHEQYHLRRFDHVVKLLAFAALCLHWFNPLVWLAFILSSKDMEMSCDEAVLGRMGEAIRQDYTISLLNLTTGRRMITGTLLAFGEGNTKERIKNAISWKRPSIRITILAAVLCITVTITCAANPKLNSLHSLEPFGHSYRVQNVVYNAPQYSFTYSAETAPQYCLTADHQLMVKEDILQESKGSDWQPLGAMSEITLTENNFDRCFVAIDGILGWREGITAESLRLKNQNAWQLIVEGDQNQVFYYVLQQKDGEVYLAYGYHAPENVTSLNNGTSKSRTASDQDTSLIRWLFQLTTIDGVSVMARTQNQETYCDMKWYPDGQFDFAYDELPSAVIYNKGSLVFTVDKDIDTLTVGEDYYSYPGKSAGIMNAEVYTLKRNSEGCFVLNVNRKNNVKDESAVYYVPFEKGKYVFRVDFPVKSSAASTLDVTDAPTDIITSKSAMSENSSADQSAPSEVSSADQSAPSEVSSADQSTPSETPTSEAAQKAALETALTKAIMEFNMNQTEKGDFACESHIILSTDYSRPMIEGQPDTVTVYAMVLYQTFDYSDEGLQIDGGSHIPTALTFEVNNNGEYTLAEYWQPRDGSYYAKDIREKFPKSIQKDALDTQKFILSQIQACYIQAIEYGKVNTTKVIEQLFQVIMSSPAAASNPGSYIDAHPIEYRELTYYSDYTLLYIFSEFMKGGQTGLKGHLMRSVMDTLISSEAISPTVSTGQEYFDAWANAAESMEANNGLDYMKTHAPKAYLFLQSTKE